MQNLKVPSAMSNPELAHYIDRIHSLVPLSGLLEEHLKPLLERMELLEAADGTKLFQTGDVDQQNTYLLKGKVVLYSEALHLEQIAADDPAARYPLAHQFPRTKTAKSKGKSVFLRVDNRLLSEALSRSSAESYAVEELDVGARNDWMAHMLGSRILQLMPSGNIQAVLSNMEKMEVFERQLIFHQGDEGDYFYFINDGTALVLRQNPDTGLDEEIARLGPGDSFGEDALISERPRNASIRMATDGMLLRLAKENFVDLIKRPLSREISYADAKRKIKAGAVWLDARPGEAHDESRLPGSINLPFELLRYQIDSLAKDREYIIFCDDGQVSSAAAYLITERGLQCWVLEEGLQSVPERDLLDPETDRQQRESERVNVAQPESKLTFEPVAGSGQPAPLALTPDDTAEAQLQQQLKALTSELEHTRSQLHSIQQQHAEELRAAKLQALSQAEEDNKRLQAELAALSGRYRVLEARSQAEINQLQSRLATKQGGTKQSSPQQVATLEATIQQLRKQLEEAETRHQAETEEMHLLWEKRLRELEAKLAARK